MEHQRGKVRTELELKAYVLFILKHFTMPVPLVTLTDLSMDRVPNYFEYMDALEDLITRDMIEEVGPGRNFRITQDGKMILESVENSVPYSIRMHTEEDIRATIIKMLRDAAVTAKSEKVGKMNRTTLELTADHGKIMTIQLLVGDGARAKEIEENFKKHAEKIYRSVTAAVLHDYSDE